MFKRHAVAVVMASRKPEAIQAMAEAATDGSVEYREAVSTIGLYRALPGASLVIVDRDDLVDAGIAWEQILPILERLPMTTGTEFARSPQEWLARARAFSGMVTTPPPRVVALTSLSGGVGKTTLAMSLARFLISRQVPVAVVELSMGPSDLQALIGQDIPDVFEVLRQKRAWGQWNGITIAPMDWVTAAMLNPEEIRQAWQGLIARHIVTIFDAPSYHQLWPVARDITRESPDGVILVVTDTRSDAMSGALYLSQMLQGAGIVLNRANLAARLQMVRPSVTIPSDDRAREFPQSLGKRLAAAIYPGWKW